MTTYTHDFSTPQASGWGPEWELVNVGTSAFSVSGGEGLVAQPAGGSDWSFARWTTPGVLSTFDLSTSFRASTDSAGDGNWYPGLLSHMPDTGAVTGYHLWINDNAGVLHLGVAVYTGGGWAWKAEVPTTVPFAANTRYHLRMRAYPETISGITRTYVTGKVWADGSQEPTDWMVVWEDTANTFSSGYAGVGAEWYDATVSNTTTFDAVSVHDTVLAGSGVAATLTSTSAQQAGTTVSVAAPSGSVGDLILAIATAKTGAFNSTISVDGTGWSLLDTGRHTPLMQAIQAKRATTTDETISASASTSDEIGLTIIRASGVAGTTANQAVQLLYESSTGPYGTEAQTVYDPATNYETDTNPTDTLVHVALLNRPTISGYTGYTGARTNHSTLTLGGTIVTSVNTEVAPFVAGTRAMTGDGTSVEWLGNLLRIRAGALSLCRDVDTFDREAGAQPEPWGPGWNMSDGTSATAYGTIIDGVGVFNGYTPEIGPGAAYMQARYLTMPCRDARVSINVRYPSFGTDLDDQHGYFLLHRWGQEGQANPNQNDSYILYLSPYGTPTGYRDELVIFRGALQTSIARVPIPTLTAGEWYMLHFQAIGTYPTELHGWLTDINGTTLAYVTAQDSSSTRQQHGYVGVGRDFQGSAEFVASQYDNLRFCCPGPRRRGHLITLT